MTFIFKFENFARKFLIFYSLLRFFFTKIFKGILYEKEAGGFDYLKKKNNLKIVDIGANDGLSSSYFLSKFNNSTIYIFEPLKLEKKSLKIKNKNRVKIFNIALGNKKEKNFLNIPYYNILFFKKKFYLSAYSTVSKKNKLIFNINKSLKTFYFYKKILNFKTLIKIKKLDDFKMKPDIIKLDVEGFEEKVILGSVNTIKKNLPILYIERPTKRTFLILRSLGYLNFVFDTFNKSFIKTKKIKKNYRNYFFINIKNLNLIKLK